jgi:hypothetical protein
MTKFASEQKSLLLIVKKRTWVFVEKLLVVSQQPTAKSEQRLSNSEYRTAKKQNKEI